MRRRIVTGRDATGRSVITREEDLVEVAYRHTPGFAQSLVWSTAAPACPEADGSGPLSQYVPGPGETVALTVTFPPDSVFADPGFDAESAVAENRRNSPGLADLFEADVPGMHTTPSVDYAVVLEGEVVLELDDGQSTKLVPGDLVVQNGTRHAWRVPGDKPATIFVVLIGHAGAPARIH